MTGSEWWGNGCKVGPLGVLDRPFSLEECRCWDGRRRHPVLDEFPVVYHRFSRLPKHVENVTNELGSYRGDASLAGSDDRALGCLRPEVRDKAM